MEPQELVKNDDTSGFSKRRISSILKVPRKSAIFPESERQEYTVECAKPAEKRSSRRVSFAPANDVLLFSKDVKNASPERSPLQDLNTATTATNRGQVAVAEDGTQPIMGMETLLNAPLHASQQRERVNFDIGEDFGEKTMMFSADDAFMDMTHSHTINIANDAELAADISLQDFDALTSSRERTVMSAADNGSMDMTLCHMVSMTSGSESLPSGRNMDLSVEKKTLSSSVPCLDLEFENFLASLSKSSGPFVNPVMAKMTPARGSSDVKNYSLAQTKTQMNEVDKENQVPSSVSVVADKSCISRKTGEPSFGSALCPKDDVSIAITEAQKGRIQGSADDDDFFRCLFPTQEMYSQSDKRVSQTSEMSSKQQQSCKTLSSSDAKAVATTEKRVQKMITEEGSQPDMTSLKSSVLHASHQKHKVNFDNKDRCREKTIMFSADDEFMDMTQSHTANIDSGPLVPQQMAADGLDPGFKQFLASLSKSSGPSVNPAITRITHTAEPLSVMPKDFESLKREEMTSGQKNSKALSSCKGMETSLKPSLKTEKVKFDAEDDCRDRTVRFTANDAAMDVTQSHTVNIATAFDLQTHQNVHTLPSCGEKTLRFTASDAAMDVTQSHTVNIAAAIEPQLHKNVNLLPICGEKTVRFTATDAAMDVTQSHTVNIATAFDAQTHQNVDLLPTCGEKTVRFTATDAAMDVTQSHTVNIATAFDPQTHQNVHILPTCGEKTVRFTATDAAMDVTQSHTVNIATAFDPQTHQNVDLLPICGEKTVRFTATDAAMDVTQSHTVNIATAFEPNSCQSVDLWPTSGEKTMRFGTNDATMDVTRSHTVKIAANQELASHQNLDFLPTCGGKTVRFHASDAAMDVTQSHTVNIAAAFDPQSHQNVNSLHTSGEKTMRFSANDVCMDVTRSHTVNIAANLKLVSHQNADFVPTGGEKTVRFTASDAAMDMTQSHTVNIAAASEPQTHQNVDLLPSCVEKTVSFTPTDSAMDVTQTHTVNIASNPVLDSVLPHQDPNIISTHRNMDLPLIVKKTEGGLCKNRFSSSHSLDPGFKNSLSKTSRLSSNPVITKATAPVVPSSQEGVDKNGYLDHHEKQRSGVNTENKALGFVQGTTEKPKNKVLTDCPEDDLSMRMTEVKTSCILGQTCTDDLPQRLSSKQDLYPNSDHLRKTEAHLQQSNEGPLSSDGLEILNHPGSVGTNETKTRKEPKITNESSPVSQKMASSPSAVDQDTDKLHSQNSRRKSLANLQSKIRRLSHMINASPETVVMDSCTVPLPQLDHELDKNSTDKTRSLSVVEPELEIGLSEDRTQGQCLKEGEQASTTATPFNLKTKQLMSRLSVGGFKPKLPQRSKPDDPKKVNSVGEHTRTSTDNVTSQLSNFDNDVSDIYDEELGSYEDMSETLDARSPQKICEKVSCSQEFNMDEPVEDYVFEEDFISAVHGQKRPLPEDENDMEDEKRVKTSSEMTTDTADMVHSEMELQSHVLERDSHITTAPTVTTQTTDYSNSSHTASMRCEATFESSFKHSLFESQLEDYASDVQKKFDDGTITVSEFFKLFNIDFVIHNPRQSVLPGRLLSDTDRTQIDLLKDRHINRPKQMVYETDVRSLTEKVEGLKVRMRDLDKPLRFVNRSLWEEMRNLSEKELKSFGAKLKERNNFFRKTSKIHSHEMKEVLYSNLVQSNLKEQQALKGTVEKADEMIKSLDDCIHDLETELAAVEEKGFDGKPGLKSCQEELKKVGEALADNERQVSELELQKKQSSNHLNRLKAETRNLENHIIMLHTVNEWKLGKKKDNRTIYTFLHDTMNLEVVCKKSNGKNAGNGPEQKISDITFKFLLNDEKANCNARLVHKLLSQYIKEESAWVEKYPTSRHVPKLLHNVGLVVSRCRLLGEELRLLQMWGGLRLDILNISSVDTQVHIVFSSLKKFAKFELVFSVSLISELYVLQLQSFKNKIGNTTIQQVEEIVASFSPGRKLLTKIVKKIHENLLR